MSDKLSRADWLDMASRLDLLQDHVNECRSALVGFHAKPSNKACHSLGLALSAVVNARLLLGAAAPDDAKLHFDAVVLPVGKRWTPDV